MFTPACKALILLGHTDVNQMSAWSHGGQRRALDPLELELQPVAGHHVGAGNEPVSSGGAASPLVPPYHCWRDDFPLLNRLDISPEDHLTTDEVSHIL